MTSLENLRDLRQRAQLRVANASRGARQQRLREWFYLDQAIKRAEAPESQEDLFPCG